MPYDFVVVGATGLQGSIVSRDLLEQGYRVLLCGRNRARVEPLLKRHRRAAFRFVELTDRSGTAAVVRGAKAPVVVNCAEGDFNLDVQRICLRVGSHYLDLGSDVRMTARQFALHEGFQRKRLCAMTGCGSVPGVGNVLLGYMAEKLDRVDAVEVGFAWAANVPVFVVPFSITSIVEEFTEPSCIFQNGRMKSLKPQSGARTVRVPWIGRQKVFLVQHPEVYTFSRYLGPKGVRSVRFYAGFPEFSYETIMTFIKSGVAAKKPVKDGVRPIDLLTQELKFNRPPKRYREREDLWVRVTGLRNGRKRTMRMDCLAPTLKGWEEHGCNIDTGLPCSIMAQMVREGIITATGSRSPEFFVPVKPFFEALAKRKMHVYENGKRIA